MASANELESYIVKILGDPSDYTKSLKTAENETRKTSSVLQREAKAATSSLATTQHATQKGVSEAVKNTSATAVGAGTSLKSASTDAASYTSELTNLATKSNVAANAQKELGKAATTGKDKFKKAEDVLKDLPKTLFGSIGGLAAGAAALGVGLFTFGNDLAEMYANTRKMRDLLRDLENDATRAVKKFGQQTQEITQNLGKKKDRGIRMDSTKYELSKAKSEVEEYQKAVAGARKEADRLDSIWKNKRGLKKAEVELKKQEGLLEAAKDRAEQLQKAFDDLQLRKDIKDAVNSLNDSLDEQVKTFGMTGAELELFKLKLMGASDEELKYARNKAAELKTLELKKSIEDVNKSLEEQILTFDKTGAEAEVLKLKQKGATDEQLAQTKKLGAELKRLEDFKKGRELKEEFLAPEEKVEKRVKELNNLLSQGAIDEKTYARAVEEANKQLAQQNKELQAIQGTASGSADALAKIIAQQDMLDDDKRSVGAFGVRKTVQAGMEAVEKPRPIPAEQDKAPPAAPPPALIQEGKDILEQLKLIHRAITDQNKRQGPDIRIGV